MGHVLRAPLGHGFAGTPTLATVPAGRLRFRGGRGASHERTQTHEPKALSPRARQLVIAKHDDLTLRPGFAPQVAECLEMRGQGGADRPLRHGRRVRRGIDTRQACDLTR